MDYKKEIIKMVREIKSVVVLIRIYYFVKVQHDKHINER